MAAGAGAERPFIGRPEAVDALRRRGDAARAGRGGFTVVEGEAGVGKSVLVRELAAEGRAKGMQVLLARAPALDDPPPFLLVREALASRGARTDPVDSRDPVGSIAFAPSAVVEAPAAERGEPGSRAGALFEESLLEPFAGPAGGGTGRGPLVAAFTAEFLRLADRGPLLAILEDLHHADEASLDCLAQLIPQTATHPVWLVGTRLPLHLIVPGRRPLLERLEHGTDADIVRLRPFTPSEAAEFVRGEPGGEGARDEEVTRWHSQSGGNPQFLEQIVRILRERGSPAGPLPEVPGGEFAEYLRQQVDRLGDEASRILAVGAVLGREFPFALLLAASGEEEERLTEAVQELVARGLLREHPNEDLEFRRDDLRTHLYAAMTEARRRLLHRRAGEALEGTGAADPATVYALARHFYLGRIDDKAAHYNRLAAEFAARAFTPLVARPHFERALESYRRLPHRDPVPELETTLDLAVQLDRLGELEAAERTLAAVIPPAGDPAIPPPLRTAAVVYLGRILSDQGRWEEVDRLTSELRNAAPATLGAAGRLALHRLRGEFEYYQGRYVESLTQHDIALALAREHGDPREIALETVRRANVLGMIPGRLDEALDGYRRASEALIQRGDLGEASFAMLFLGVVLSQHGRNAEGLGALTEARRLAERSHDLRRLGWALFNIADLEREAGHLDVAREANARSREILARIGDRFGLAQAEIIAGKILLDSGELAAAEAPLLEAYRLVRELRTAADEVEVVLRLAELACARGDLVGARARADELGRQGIERLRPDLAPEYRRLLERIAPEATGDG